MKKNHTALYRLLGLFSLPLILLLFTQPLQISCGSATTGTSTIEAENISDMPEAIPAPIAKSEVDFGVKSDSPVFTPADSPTDDNVGTISFEIYGSEEAIVGIVIDGEFFDFITTSGLRGSFQIAENKLDVGISLVVLSSDSTTSNILAVSPPIVAKVQKLDNEFGLQVGFTNVKQTTGDTDIAAEILRIPPLVLEGDIYFSAMDSNDEPSVFSRSFNQGGFHTLLTNQLLNPIQYMQLGASDTIVGTDENTGQINAISLIDSTIATAAPEGDTDIYPSNRYFIHSPDDLWRAIVFNGIDSTSLRIQLASLSDDATGFLVGPDEAVIKNMRFVFINPDNSATVRLLATKEYGEHFELQIIRTTTALPTDPNTNVTVTYNTLVTTSNVLEKPVVDKVDFLEALYLCGGEDGLKDVCVLNLDNNATGPLIDGIDFDIVRADYADDNLNVVIEADYDSETLLDNQLFLFNRSTETLRLLTRGHDFRVNRETGIIGYILEDKGGNNQIGIFNLNNL